jgi:hypothetical protein
VPFRHAVYVGEVDGRELRAPILVEERLLLEFCEPASP